MRPAEAELRFVVSGLGEADAAGVGVEEQVKGYTLGTAPERRLGVVLMLRDKSYSPQPRKSALAR